MVNMAGLRNPDLAAKVISDEWVALATSAGLIEKLADDRRAQEAAFDSCTLRGRSLINFLCGNERGGYHPKGTDLQPKDFLGRQWWPHDDLDRRLRGRLPYLNSRVAHLTWHQVLDFDDQIVLWVAFSERDRERISWFPPDLEKLVVFSVPVMVRQIHAAICQFIDALEADGVGHQVPRDSVEEATSVLPRVVGVDGERGLALGPERAVSRRR
jgi:hypothetical protein